MASVKTKPDREFSFSQKDFKFLSGLIYDQTGIVLGEQKFDMMYGRLARRLRELGFVTVADYIDYIASDSGEDELPNLVNAMTTNLTRFFREAHHFDMLRDGCLAPLVQHQFGKDERPRLRIWSAGCSSGMEPYTIAMTLAECVPNFARWDALVLATDIDTKMLERGRAGIYVKDDIDDIPPLMRKKYLRRDSPETIQIEDKLRAMIRFKKLNLMHQWPLKGHFQAIFCRNVLIYFDKETRLQLVSRFTQQLEPGGFLFLGHSEAIIGDQTKGLKSLGRSAFQRVAR